MQELLFNHGNLGDLIVYLIEPFNFPMSLVLMGAYRAPTKYYFDPHYLFN